MSKFKPWITYQAVKFLRHRLTSEMNVFEFGCGSSTIFYAELCKFVRAVEHDPAWAPKVVKTLEQRRLSNWQIHHVRTEDERPAGCTKDFLIPSSYYSKGRSAWFKKYAYTIDQDGGRYDVISVDGGARVSCVMRAIPRLAPGGYLILDNSERPRYAPGMNLVPADWKQWDFLGIGSVNAWRAAMKKELRTKKWQTTIWQRPAA